MSGKIKAIMIPMVLRIGNYTTNYDQESPINLIIKMQEVVKLIMTVIKIWDHCPRVRNINMIKVLVKCLLEAGIWVNITMWMNRITKKSIHNIQQ